MIRPTSVRSTLVDRHSLQYSKKSLDCHGCETTQYPPPVRDEASITGKCRHILWNSYWKT